MGLSNSDKKVLYLIKNYLENENFANEDTLNSIKDLFENENFASEDTLDTRLSNLENKIDALLQSQDTDNDLNTKINNAIKGKQTDGTITPIEVDSEGQLSVKNVTLDTSQSTIEVPADVKIKGSTDGGTTYVPVAVDQNGNVNVKQNGSIVEEIKTFSEVLADGASFTSSLINIEEYDWFVCAISTGDSGTVQYVQYDDAGNGFSFFGANEVLSSTSKAISNRINTKLTQIKIKIINNSTDGDNETIDVILYGG